MNFLGIGKKVDPTEQAKEWKREIVRQQKTIERDIGKIKKEEQKAIAECKKLAKANQVGAARIIAKEIINTRKSIERMSVMKSQMHSVELQLQSSISIMKIQGCLSKSTEIMTAMNGLMRLPELNKALMGMAREMERAGLIEEVMDDTMSMLDVRRPCRALLPHSHAVLCSLMDWKMQPTLRWRKSSARRWRESSRRLVRPPPPSKSAGKSRRYQYSFTLPFTVSDVVLLGGRGRRRHGRDAQSSVSAKIK